jgi:hypothetical protein
LQKFRICSLLAFRKNFEFEQHWWSRL